MLFNWAREVHRARGTYEVEPVAERAIEKAQDLLHYDTAYEVSAAMVEWFALDGDLEKAMIIGPLLHVALTTATKGRYYEPAYAGANRVDDR